MFEKYVVISFINDIYENKIDGNFLYQINNSRNIFKKFLYIYFVVVFMIMFIKYQDKNYVFIMDLMMYQVYCINSFLNNKCSF